MFPSKISFEDCKYLTPTILMSSTKFIHVWGEKDLNLQYIWQGNYYMAKSNTKCMHS